MRLIAVAAGSEVGASLGGSLEVVATGVLFGTPGGLGYLVVRKLVPGSGLWRGALFGALYFGFLALVPPPAARSAVAALGQLPVALSLFGFLFVGYGLLLEATLRRLMKE